MLGTEIINQRRVLEALIEQMIALLDHIDGDADMEPDLAGFDPRATDDREEEETDQNGDEGDFSRCEDDATVGDLWRFEPGHIGGGLGL
jgi:hypothetical protein